MQGRAAGQHKARLEEGSSCQHYIPNLSHRCVLDWVLRLQKQPGGQLHVEETVPLNSSRVE